MKKYERPEMRIVKIDDVILTELDLSPTVPEIDDGTSVPDLES
ncbi:MAG: hypothetical protein UHS49_05105 [Faecalimonas sp.]|nr:hypothetical protein [Faecalimonas sp.]